MQIRHKQRQNVREKDVFYIKVFQIFWIKQKTDEYFLSNIFA